MKISVVIVAGGSGARMNSELPKQFINLLGKPILMHTIERFYVNNPNSDIRLVLPSDQKEQWSKLCTECDFTIPHKIYKGGKTRFHSVKNGLEGIEKGQLVAIHDGVRPFISNETIERCIEQAKLTKSAIPVIDIYETVRDVSGIHSFTVPRDNYKLVQTPQVFQSDILIEAYAQDFITTFTDDASVVESLGYKVSLVKGNRENIKITTPIDLKIARAFFSEE